MAYKSPETAKQYHHDLYQWCVERGVCAWCKKVYAEPGRVYCKGCTRRNKALIERRDPGHEQRNAYCRERRKRLKAEGLCIDCGKRQANEGRTRCPVCARKKRESDQVSRIGKRIKKRTSEGGGAADGESVIRQLTKQALRGRKGLKV